MDKFEGHMNKEATTGAGIFHPKHGPMAVSTATVLPPGHPTFGVHKAKRGHTSAAFVKKVGG